MMRSLIALMVLVAVANAAPSGWAGGGTNAWPLPNAGVSLPNGIVGSTAEVDLLAGGTSGTQLHKQHVPAPITVPDNENLADPNLAEILNLGGSIVPPARTFFFGSEAFCSTRAALPTNWIVENRQSQYRANFTGETKLCRRDFVEVCTTFTGVVPCNSYTHRCVDVPDTLKYADPVYHPEYTSRIVTRPQVCVSKGVYMAPDAAVVFIAQVMFSWVLLTLGFALAFNAAGKDRGTLLMKVVAALVYIPIVLLLFSYYYLNAILAAAAIYASYQLFCRKRSEATAFAFVFLFLALFWVTFENGLGDMQHQSRLRGASNLARDYTYENYCEGYYRGMFTVPREIQGDFDNPSFKARQYCDRRWLSAELFFMIMLELSFLLAALVGGAAIWAPEPEKVVATETEMETRA